MRAPALVASDQHAGEGHSQHDLYLFAFLPGLIAATQADLQKVIEAEQPHYLIHVMPDGWKRPSQWNPLGRLVLKSEAEERLTIEIGGQDEGREMRSCTVELPPRTRVEIQERVLFPILCPHQIQSQCTDRNPQSQSARKPISSARPDWGNIWVYGMDVLLAGYITREEFQPPRTVSSRLARVSSNTKSTQVKNLAVLLSDLKPLTELFRASKVIAQRS